MTCAELQDRLVDYLYGELPPAERKAFEAHLAGCEGCRSEVEALGTTLARTRAAVRTTLDEPPARVRGTVLAAAARAAQAPGGTVPISGEEAAGMAARLLAWLRRPWVLPVFAAASVMAVFVMARRTIVTEERPAEPAALEPAPPAPAPAPAPAAKDEALRGVLQPVPDRAEGSASAGVPRPRRTVHQKAVSVERRRALDGVRGKADEGMPGELDRRQSERERKTAAGGAGRAAAAPVRVLNDEPLDAMDARAAARLEKGKETAAKKALPMRSYAERPPAPMPAAAPPGAAQARPSAAALESAPEEAPAARDAENPAKSAGPLPYDELVRRAERAFSGERWADAAASYRELLRRFPGDRGAAAWKVRLARCDQALSR